MLKNYFKIAFRNLLKFKGYAAINILGLAIGLACCMFIIQHLRDEMKHDAHHESVDRLYRVCSSFKLNGEETFIAGSPGPLAWGLLEEFPEVEASTRLLVAPNVNQYLIRRGEYSFFEEDGILADSNFFQVLSYDFVEGAPESALLEPYNIVVSQKMAQKIFGAERALGQTIRVADQWEEHDYKITGVINTKDFPSHIKANFFMHIGSGPIGQYFENRVEWAGNNVYYTYIRLKPGASIASVESKLPAFVEEKAGTRLRELGFEKGHFTEAVKDIYLTSETEYPIGPRGDISLIYIFAAIAAFILLIACINFMNLSTAKATVRAREVGVRKVIGANRRMLSGQFFTEALVYTLMAVLVAQLLGNLSLPIFNQLSGKELTLSFINDPQLLLMMGGILLLTALVAGSYPALYLSSFSPVKIFKGNVGDRFSARQIRKGLVLVQFIVSIALIQGIFVVQKQLNYMQEKKLGFEPDAKLVVPLNTPDAMQNYTVLKETLLKNSDVLDVGGTSAVPGLPNIVDILVFAEGANQDASIRVMRNWVDPDFMPMMEFELLAGRFFDEDRIADTVVSVVINE
ncbi:MAG: ABC transporter permease, partial [Bacteroidota bacterium]